MLRSPDTGKDYEACVRVADKFSDLRKETEAKEAQFAQFDALAELLQTLGMCGCDMVVGVALVWV